MMSFKLREFGSTSYTLSPVGFGAWAAGGGGWNFSWGFQDDADTIAAIRRAVGHGVNWIDTAPAYGHGHSEEVVGRAIADIPASERPYVFTKCGLEWNPHNHMERSRRVGDPAVLRRSVEESLRRLDVEVLDLLFMHWPAADGTPLETYWRTLLDLKSEGKVRAVGLSNHSTEQLDICEALGHVDVLQNPFSAVRRDLAALELPWCRQHGTAILAYSPLQSGLLSGSFSRERAAALPKDDWRSRDARFQGNELDSSLAVASAFVEIGRARGVSAAAAAIAWTLSWKGISGTIVGARNAAQVDGWIAGSTLVLNEAELDLVARAIEESALDRSFSKPV